jgi:hypothetical protein
LLRAQSWAQPEHFLFDDYQQRHTRQGGKRGSIRKNFLFEDDRSPLREHDTMSSSNALKPPRHAPYPDFIDHATFRAYMRTPHDLGGEPDEPIQWEEKEESQCRTPDVGFLTY